MLDAAYPKGALDYWKSISFQHLLTKLLTRSSRRSADVLHRWRILIEHFHGAATRVGVSETAFPHRADGYNLLILTQWLQPEASIGCRAWTRESYSRIEPFVGEGRYVNYLGDDEPGDPVLAAYGPNYKRLQEIKTKYDPTNFFHMNQNIKPLASVP